MAKFKVGDKIKGVVIGNIYTIIYVGISNYFVEGMTTAGTKFDSILSFDYEKYYALHVELPKVGTTVCSRTKCSGSAYTIMAYHKLRNIDFFVLLPAASWDKPEIISYTELKDNYYI